MYREGLKGWLKHFDFILLDMAVVVLSFILAFGIRHGFQNFWNREGFRVGIVIVLIGTPLLSILFFNHKNILKRGYLKELLAVIQLDVAINLALLLLLFYMHIAGGVSRLAIGFFAVIFPVLLYLVRILWKKMLLRRFHNSEGAGRQLLMLATKHEAELALANFQNENRSYGSMNVIGLIAYNSTLQVGDKVCGIPVVTTMEEAGKYMLNRWVDGVLIFLPRREKRPDEFLQMCAEMGITTQTRIEFDTNRETMTTVEKNNKYIFLTESIRVASTRDLFFKRCMDIIGSLFGLFITGILVVFIGPAIFFADPGNIFFSQTRVGRNGRKFKIRKFRSMYKDAEARKKELMEKNKMQGLMFKMDNDPRIIGSGQDGTGHGIGWFIRKTSIDEFPQFWNVFKGDMSLCGTRPPTEEEFNNYMAHHRARLAMKPGVTGLWQTSGRSNITDFEEVVQMDMEYINTWSLTGDLKLIVKTIGIVLKGNGAV